jgi:DnaJ homolog subfamily C member 2
MAEENRCRLIANLATPFATKRVQCVGKQFLKLHNIHHDNEEEISRSSSSDQLFSDESKFHVDVDYLKSLDPKDWKEQDHYAVLGLKSLR